MINIKLNNNLGNVTHSNDYKLDATQQYVICIENELEEQANIAKTVKNVGLEALNDYYDWLESNGISVDYPNPTNQLVSTYYGVKPLWKTELSQGIVVKAEDDDDYYIVMECSNLVPGFRSTQIILTMGGCR